MSQSVPRDCGAEGSQVQGLGQTVHTAKQENILRVSRTIAADALATVTVRPAALTAGPGLRPAEWCMSRT